MQGTLVPVLQIVVSGEQQTSRFTKTTSFYMTELRIAGSLMGRLGSTTQSPHSCAGCSSFKVGTDCGYHNESVSCSPFWSRPYKFWCHVFYDSSVGINWRKYGQSCWNSLNSLIGVIGLDWGCYIGYWCDSFEIGSNCGADFDIFGCWTPKVVTVGW